MHVKLHFQIRQSYFMVQEISSVNAAIFYALKEHVPRRGSIKDIHRSVLLEKYNVHDMMH